jgi:hypothetical protein
VELRPYETFTAFLAQHTAHHRGSKVWVDGKTASQAIFRCGSVMVLNIHVAPVVYAKVAS